MHQRSAWIWVFTGAALLLALLSLCAGSVPVHPAELLAALRGAGPSTVQIILWQVRLPEVLTAALAGAGLATSGLVMQTVFRNPLAGPSVLGVSSGASLGVALVLLAGPAWMPLPLPAEAMAILAALGGALAVLLLITAMDRRVGGATTLLIMGLMVGYLCGAVVSVLQSLSGALALKGFVQWGMGSFAGLDLGRTAWFAPPVLAGVCASLWLVKPLNGLLLGEEYARSLGVDVHRTRRAAIGITGLLAGTITAFCGPIAFLGLATPHVARACVRTNDHRVLLPASAALGAALGLGCDLVVRTVGAERAVPLNAVTSLLGAPVVLWVLLRGRRWSPID
jgi:iron complex transport system permease protein